MTQTINHDRDEAIARALQIVRTPRAFGGPGEAHPSIFEAAPGYHSISHGHSSLDYSNSDDGTLASVGHLETPPEHRGRGSARELMKQFLAGTDRAGVRTALTPAPMDKSTSVHGLREFYGGLGYRQNPNVAKNGLGTPYGNEGSSISDLAMVRDPAQIDSGRVGRAPGGGFEVARHKAPGINIPKTTKMHVGPIHSAVAGRTDHLPMTVHSGSYVLPADVVSAHGEGNSVAGFKVMRRTFGGVPYGNHGGGPYGQTGGPYGAPMGHAAGGAVKPQIATYKNSWRDEAPLGQYDRRFYNKVPNPLIDENGSTIASKERLVPKRKIQHDVPATPSPNTIFRGMSHGEFEDFRRTGKIKSQGTHNIGDQQDGLTYFSTDPRSAQSYANSFAPSQFKPTWDKPAYIAAVRRPEPEAIRSVPGTSNTEVGVARPVGQHEVSDVYRGDVVDYSPEDKNPSGGGTAASATLNWSKMKPDEWGTARAAGGATHSEDQGVPIVAAGGEYVLSPEQVMAVGDGDLERGHRVLDAFVTRSRAKLVKTLRKLPGPAR